MFVWLCNSFFNPEPSIQTSRLVLDLNWHPTSRLRPIWCTIHSVLKHIDICMGNSTLPHSYDVMHHRLKIYFHPTSCCANEGGVIGMQMHDSRTICPHYLNMLYVSGYLFLLRDVNFVSVTGACSVMATQNHNTDGKRNPWRSLVRADL